MENINVILNSDLVVVLSAILTSIIGILRIISKTSIGKKALNKLTKLHDEKNVELDKVTNDLKDANKKAEEITTKIIEDSAEKEKFYKEQYEKALDKINNLEEFLVKCLSYINNANVKKELEELKNEEGIDSKATEE